MGGCQFRAVARHEVFAICFDRVQVLRRQFLQNESGFLRQISMCGEIMLQSSHTACIATPAQKKRIEIKLYGVDR